MCLGVRIAIIFVMPTKTQIIAISLALSMQLTNLNVVTEVRLDSTLSLPNDPGYNHVVDSENLKNRSPQTSEQDGKNSRQPIRLR